VYLANPQSLVWTPTFPLVLLFGTALGIKLTLVVYLFCAFDGSYRLGRIYGMSIPAAALAAILVGTGGWFALHYAEGHATFLGATLFPYAMLCYRHAVDDVPGKIAWEWTIPLGAVAAWIVGDGGTSTPPMCMVILATLALIDAGRWRSPRPFAPLVVAGVVAFLVGAVRVLPALEFALDHPRHLFETDANALWQMVGNAYRWKGIEPVAGKRYWFHEYGWRLPAVTVPLWLWALRVRRALTVWIFVAVGAAIVAGSAWPYGPWWLLHKLPIFRDLRVPSRYQIMFAIGVPLLCALALDDLRARRHWRGWMTVTVLVLALVEGLAFDWVRWWSAFDKHHRLARAGEPFHQVVGEWRSMLTNVLDNHGAIGCDEEAPLQRALKLDEGPGPQARLEPGVGGEASGGELHGVRWTPNRVEADVTLGVPTVVSVNENWNEHWRARLEDGAPVEVMRVGPKWPRDVDGGRLGATVPAGRHTVTFYYRPRSFLVGAILNGISIPIFVGLWLWLRRRRRSLVAAVSE
jgi:hypothetical protein